MSTDDDKKPGNMKGKGKSGAVRPPVIDLKATEVKDGKNSGKTEKPAAKAAPRPGKAPPAPRKAPGKKAPDQKPGADKATGKEAGKAAAKGVVAKDAAAKDAAVGNTKDMGAAKSATAPAKAGEAAKKETAAKEAKATPKAETTGPEATGKVPPKSGESKITARDKGKDQPASPKAGKKDGKKDNEKPGEKNGKKTGEQEKPAEKATTPGKKKNVAKEAAKAPAASEGTKTTAPAASGATGPGRLPPQPRKGAAAKGALALAVLLGIGAAGGGGYWLYQKTQTTSRTQAAATQAANQLAAEIGEMKKELAALRQENAALKKGLEELRSRAATAPAARPQELAALRESSDKLAEMVNANSRGLAETRQKLSDLAARFAAIEGALSKAAENGEATPAQQQAAASLKAEQIRQQMEKSLGSLKAKLSELEKRLAETGGQTGVPEEVSKQLAAHEAALKELRGKLEEMRGGTAKAAETASKAAAQAAAAVAALEALKKNPPKPRITPPPAGAIFAALHEKARKGEPFAEELNELKKWLPGLDLYARLDKVAATGARPRAALGKQLDELAAKYAAARAEAMKKQGGGGLLGSIKSRLSKVVKVRKAGQADWAGALAEARKALAGGSLAAAINVLNGQPGEKPEDVAAWLAEAEKRMLVDKSVSGLGDFVIAHIADFTKNAGKTE